MIHYKAFTQLVVLPTKLTFNPAMLSRSFRVQTTTFKCWGGRDHLQGHKHTQTEFNPFGFDFKDFNIEISEPKVKITPPKVDFTWSSRKYSSDRKNAEHQQSHQSQHHHTENVFRSRTHKHKKHTAIQYPSASESAIQSILNGYKYMQERPVGTVVAGLVLYTFAGGALLTIGKWAAMIGVGYWAYRALDRRIMQYLMKEPFYHSTTVLEAHKLAIEQRIGGSFYVPHLRDVEFKFKSVDQNGWSKVSYSFPVVGSERSGRCEVTMKKNARVSSLSYQPCKILLDLDASENHPPEVVYLQGENRNN